MIANEDVSHRLDGSDRVQRVRRWNLRLVQQLLTESMVLALAGGLLAMPMSWWGSLALLRMISTGDARIPMAVDPD
jgi:hypothetical protein